MLFFAGLFRATVFLAAAVFLATVFFAAVVLAAAFFAGAFVAALALVAERLTRARADATFLAGDFLTTLAAPGTRSASISVERLESLLELVEALGHEGHLLGDLALHVGGDALGRFAASIDELLHDSFGVASLDLTPVDQLFHERVRLFARHFGELDARIDQLLDGGYLHRRMLVVRREQGARNAAQVGHVERVGR